MVVLPAPVLRVLSLLPLLSLLAAAASVDPPSTGSRWVWPLDPLPVVIARFDPPADAWGAGHRGVDLAAAIGQPVRAPRSGTVSFAGVVAGRPVVVVSHTGGLRSTLEPVLSTSAVGTAIDAGFVVGTMAPVPGHCSPATCLHWGVLRVTTYLDPLSFVAPRRVILLPLYVGPGRAAASRDATGGVDARGAPKPEGALPRTPPGGSGAARPG